MHAAFLPSNHFNKYITLIQQASNSKWKISKHSQKTLYKTGHWAAWVGTALFDMRDPDPKWTDTKNRDLIATNVNDLTTQFRVKIGRYQNAYRMHATFSNQSHFDEFTALVQKTS